MTTRSGFSRYGTSARVPISAAALKLRKVSCASLRSHLGLNVDPQKVAYTPKASALLGYKWVTDIPANFLPNSADYKRMKQMKRSWETFPNNWNVGDRYRVAKMIEIGWLKPVSLGKRNKKPADTEYEDLDDDIPDEFWREIDDCIIDKTAKATARGAINYDDGVRNTIAEQPSSIRRAERLSELEPCSSTSTERKSTGASTNQNPQMDDHSYLPYSPLGNKQARTMLAKDPERPVEVIRPELEHSSIECPHEFRAKRVKSDAVPDFSNIVKPIRNYVALIEDIAQNIKSLRDDTKEELERAHIREATIDQILRKLESHLSATENSLNNLCTRSSLNF